MVSLVLSPYLVFSIYRANSTCYPSTDCCSGTYIILVFIVIGNVSNQSADSVTYACISPLLRLLSHLSYISCVRVCHPSHVGARCSGP